MKKLIITIFTLTFIGNSVHALDKLDFNLEVSPAVSWINFHEKQVKQDGAKIKLNAGLTVGYNFTDSFSLLSGLRLNTLGGNLKGNDEKVLYEMQEFEIPVEMKFRTPEVIDNIRFSFNLGVGCGIAFKGHATKDYPADYAVLNYENEHFDYKLMPFRALYNIGAGVEYDLSGLRLTARLNYKGCLTKTYFYSDGMSHASTYLDLNDSYPGRMNYNEKIKFYPKAFELAIGVIF